MTVRSKYWHEDLLGVVTKKGSPFLMLNVSFYIRSLWVYCRKARYIFCASSIIILLGCCCDRLIFALSQKYSRWDEREGTGSNEPMMGFMPSLMHAS